MTRLEIAEAVRPAFDRGGAGRDEIVAAAIESGIRPEVIEALRGLPQRRYERLNQIWEELDDIPVGV